MGFVLLLWQPLDGGAISLACARGQAVFPVRFPLAGTMSSCWPPCGVCCRGAGCQPRNDSIRGMKAAWSWNKKAWPASG